MPVAATNLATSPLDVHSLPLDVSSLQNLIQAFVRVQAQVETECGDESGTGTQPNADGDQTQPGVADAGDNAAANDLSNSRAHLSPSRIVPGTGGVE